jgi:ketosteroid isomerase-like protein
MLDEQFAREFAERYVEAWNSHDSAQIEPLVTPDVVWLDPALPEPARGVEIPAILHDFGAPLRLEPASR